MTTAALIVAAGVGERFGAAGPKQYERLAGKPLLRRSLEAFLRHPGIDLVRAIIHPDHVGHYGAATAGLDVLPPVHGGATRQESCRLGLESLAGRGVETVLIHDAARPLVSQELISRTLDALRNSDAAVAACQETDTVKVSEDGRWVSRTMDRRTVWRAQTPQGFGYKTICRAHEAAADQRLTDDAAVVEHIGAQVALVAGDPDNIKITTMNDLKRAERILADPADIRVGTGFDAHKFDAGTKVRLCGVDIEHDRGLAGHSDADVGLHALTDAILGALGEGDIGKHFPSTDERWRGQDSEVFLRHAMALAGQRNARVRHVDVTLICQAPRVSGVVPAMRQRVAEIMGLEVGRVSIKATTTDFLGFTGRKEGIAAQAAATLAFGRDLFG